MHENSETISTEGGPLITGNVTTNKDFIGRDKIEKHIHVYEDKTAKAKLAISNLKMKKDFGILHRQRCQFDLFIENAGQSDIYAFKLFIKAYPPHRSSLVRQNYLSKCLLDAGNTYVFRDGQPAVKPQDPLYASGSRPLESIPVAIYPCDQFLVDRYEIVLEEEELKDTNEEERFEKVWQELERHCPDEASLQNLRSFRNANWESWNDAVQNRLKLHWQLYLPATAPLSGILDLRDLFMQVYQRQCEG